MKYFSCQPDSHNAFGSLSNCTLTYFTVDCPRGHTWVPNSPAPETASSPRPRPSTSTCSQSQRDQPPSVAGGREEDSAHARSSSLASAPLAAGLVGSSYAAASGCPPPPSPAASPWPSPAAAQETRVHVQSVCILPDCFHAQSSCFSMANRSLFGMDLAFVGTSNGLLTLVVLSERSIVFMPKRDPDYLRALEQRQRYNQFTRGGGSSGYASSTAPAARASASGRRGVSRDALPSSAGHRGRSVSCRESGAKAAAELRGERSASASAADVHTRAHHRHGIDHASRSGDGLSDGGGTTTDGGAGSSYSNSVADGGAGRGSTHGGMRVRHGTGAGAGDDYASYPSDASYVTMDSLSSLDSPRHRARSRDAHDGRPLQQQQQQQPFLTGDPNDSSGSLTVDAAAVGDDAGGATHSSHRRQTGPGAQSAQRRRSALRHLETPSTIVWMRDKPLVLVGYTSGRVEWYQVWVSAAKQQQLAGPAAEQPYQAAIPAGSLMQYINDPQVTQACRTRRVYIGGEGDGVRAELLTGCVLPDSGALMTSDYFPANGTVVVGGERCIAVFSSEQLETPLCRLPAFGCNFLYCHPFLPLIGTLSWGWGTVGPCYYLSHADDGARSQTSEDSTASATRPTQPDVFVGNPNGFGGGCLLNILELVAEDSAAAGTTADSTATRLGRGPAAGVAGATDPSAGVARGGQTGRPRSGSVASRVSLRHVQQRLLASHSPRYGAYFSFSWKFSFDLELGVCNVDEGLVYIVRLHRGATRAAVPSVGPDDDALSPSRDLELACGGTAEAGRSATGPRFPYVFTHEHRLRLPLHSLVNIEYVSAATSTLNSATAPTVAMRLTRPHSGQAVADGFVESPTSKEGQRPVETAAAAALQRWGGRRGLSVSIAAATATERFSALYRAQDARFHSAASAARIAPSIVPNGRNLSLLGANAASVLHANHARLLVGVDGGEGSRGVTAGGAATGRGQPAPLHLQVAGGGASSGLALMENMLAAEMLHPTASSASTKRSKTRGDGRYTSLMPTTSSPHPSTRASSHAVMEGTGGHGAAHRGEGSADLRGLLRVGAGPTSCVVGMNYAGEVASVAVEMEAVATWHEEGSVFVALGASVCAADIVSIQGIERQMKRRMEAGFRLSAEENSTALETVARKSTRYTYSGMNNANSTTAMSDLTTIFTYVSALMKVGLIGPVGDVPSVCELLSLQKQQGEHPGRAGAILASALTKLPQAVLDQLELRRPPPPPPLQPASRVETGGSAANVEENSTSPDTLRLVTRLLLLHILRWLPPSVSPGTARGGTQSRPAEDADHPTLSQPHPASATPETSAGRDAEAAFSLDELSSDSDVERAVAVQVLHSRFSAGASLLRRFCHRNPSYLAVANLIARHDGTIGAIRESSPHIRETFLSSLSPWLLAVFLFLCTDAASDTQDYRARIYTNASLPLWDRVAIALLLEHRADHLHGILHDTLLRDCTLIQAIMLAHGISRATYPIMQAIVDGTGDFQLGACLYARVGVLSPLFDTLFPNDRERHRCRRRAPSYGMAAPGTALWNGPEDAAELAEERAAAVLHGQCPATSLVHCLTPPANHTTNAADADASSGPSRHATASAHSLPATPVPSVLDPARLARSALPPSPWCRVAPAERLPAARAGEAVRASNGSVRDADSFLSVFSSLSATPAVAATTATTTTALRHRWHHDASHSTQELPGEGGRAAADADADADCPWVWWAAAYRAFMDSEQAFVERTMFDVACQRLREDAERNATTPLFAAARAADEEAAKTSTPSVASSPGATHPAAARGRGGPPHTLAPREELRCCCDTSATAGSALSFDGGLFPPFAQALSSPFALGAAVEATPQRWCAAAAGSPGVLTAATPPQIDAQQYRMLLGALSNRQPSCSVCQQPVQVHQRDSDKSLAWCTACQHGGHADHLRQWFSQHRRCPVECCRCHCDEDASLY